MSFSLSLPALGQRQMDRVYSARQIPEGCDRAERERLPICFLHTGLPHPDVDQAARDRAAKEAAERLSAECVVITGLHPEKGSELFADLQLRTAKASLALDFLEAVLIDPWQEERLGGVKVNDWEIGREKSEERLYSDFLKETGELMKKAREWKAANAPKPEQWTDGKGRSMTAAAVSWDGQNAVFRLQNGKTAKLDAAALSAESALRLSKTFRPKLPFVNAADEAALAAAAGKEVCVVGRVRLVTSVGWPGSERGKDNYVPFSAFFAAKFDAAVGNLLLTRNQAAYGDPRGRAYGLLEKETGPDGKQKYVIRVTDPRQLGPGAEAE